MSYRNQRCLRRHDDSEMAVTANILAGIPQYLGEHFAEVGFLESTESRTRAKDSHPAQPISGLSLAAYTYAR